MMVLSFQAILRAPRFSWARCTLAAGLLGLAALPIGCATGPSLAGTRTPTTGPHGGVAVALPGEQGFGEVVIEPAAARPGRQEDPQAQVAVYFLKPDLAGTLAQLPTDVSVKLLLPGQEAQTITLTPQPKGSDPAGAGRFASKSGPYLVDQTIGELTAKVGGESFTKPFASPR